MEEPGAMSQQPMVEMSQDCIEWDESRNIDLRHLDKSPFEGAEPRSCGRPTVRPNAITTPRSSSSNAKSCPSSLEGVKRRLEKTTGISPSPEADSSFRPHNNNSNNNNMVISHAPLPRRKIQPTEREIDGIFSTLEEEEARLGPDQLSPPIDGQGRVLPLATDTTAKTQPTRNNRFIGAEEEPIAGTEASLVQNAKTAQMPAMTTTATSSSTSQAARHRRRRPRETENIHPNLLSSNKQRRFERSIVRKQPQAATTASTNPHTMVEVRNKIDDDDDGDFEALLKQMDAPQSTTPQRRTPTEEETAIPGRSSTHLEHSDALERHPAKHCSATSSNSISTTQVKQATRTPQATCTTSMTCRHVPHPSEFTAMAPMHPCPPQYETNIAMRGPNAVGGQGQSQPPTRLPTKPGGNQRALQRLDQPNTVRHNKITSVGGSYAARLDKSNIAPSRNPAPDAFKMPPPPAKRISMPPPVTPSVPPRPIVVMSKTDVRKVDTVKTSTSDLNNSDDDEFGELDLTQMDFGDIDALLAIQSSQQLTQVEPSNRNNTMKSKGCMTNHETDKTRMQTTQAIFKSTTTKMTSKLSTPIVLNKASIVKAKEDAPATEDEFGDFPEIDFDAIDQVIAKRDSLSPTCVTLPTVSYSVPAAARAPPSSMFVKNLKTESFDAEGFAFLNFSRYKVIRVEEDSSTYTKSLLVAGWTSEMMEQEKSDKGIHKTMKAPTPKRNIEWQPDGCIYLRCEWYHTRVAEGDVFHLCSPSGKYRTDAAALPITVDSAPPIGSDVDDLLVVMHPDLLITPTTVSEAFGCIRRAVLKSRLGSTGLTSKAALFGTMRHELFGVCMKEQDFSMDSAQINVKKIVRRNATSLIGCGMTVHEAESGVLDVLPTIQQFATQYTRFGVENGDEVPFDQRPLLEGHAHQPSIRAVADVVESIEEPVISPELGLKGNIDAVVNVTSVSVNSTPSSSTGPQNSSMCLELKTGHNQNSQHAHMTQLSLYTLMLRVRQGIKDSSSYNKSSSIGCSQFGGSPDTTGAAAGGILLYLNQKSTRSVHVSPETNEVKSLIGQRNVVAGELLRASRPRGIKLAYEDQEKESEDKGPSFHLLPASPAQLPDVQASTHACGRCYANRECMLYAAAERSLIPSHMNLGIEQSHRELLTKFTSHLAGEDLAYFTDWDRLIDLEADASSYNAATAWLLESARREKDIGESVSSLVFDGVEPSSSSGEGDRVLIGFRRSANSAIKTPFSRLSLGPGCQLIISTDDTSFRASNASASTPRGTGTIKRQLRPQMHVVRGYMERAEEGRILVRASRDDLERIRKLAFRSKDIHTQAPAGPSTEGRLFRIDKDNTAVGIGTLRQNLVNLFTGDVVKQESQDKAEKNPRQRMRLSWLRDVVVRLKQPIFDISALSKIFCSDPGASPLHGCDLESLAFEYAELNSDQRAAVEKVICAKDYTLIQGLPGTGKTSTLTFVARLLAARGKRVLITSYTHAAVDNVAMKLMESGLATIDRATRLPALVRIGPKGSCHAAVHKILASELAIGIEEGGSALVADNYSMQSDGGADDIELPSATSLFKVVSSARIICTTALSVPRSPLLAGQNFDVVIVDEAGQISQPAILGAMMAADSFVLVGDHLQLPPLVNSEIADKGGYGISMLKRLAEKYPNSIAPLTYQYRMNAAICQLSSDAVYGGNLKCANDQVGSRILALPRYPRALPPPISKEFTAWLPAVIYPRRSVLFLDTDKIKSDHRSTSEVQPLVGQVGPTPPAIDALEEKIGGTYDGKIVNRTEASLVRLILHGLISAGLPASEIGVICPFRAQLRILEDDSVIEKYKNDGVELSTIDRYQGRDKQVILISFVRSNVRGKTGRLLQDMRRLNVAMTRAKCKLLMIGSFSTLKSGSDVLKPVLEGIDKRLQRYILPQNATHCYDIP